MSTQSSSTLTLTGIRDTHAALRTLHSNHPEWASKTIRQEPLYAIPYEALSNHQLANLFDTTVKAEREFSQLCRDHHCIGFWGRNAIHYHHLTRVPLQIDPVLRSQLGWSMQQANSITSLHGSSDTAHERLLGVTGWLTTEPMYLQEVEILKTEYDSLPLELQPRFPLARALTYSGHDRQEQLPEPVTAFHQTVCHFLDRWGLMDLTTWDLPNPQGPLLPNLLPEGPARPEHGVHIYVPLHYPLQGDDGLLQRVREAQQQQATMLGIPSGFGGITHHTQYAQMFRALYIELAILSRFPRRIRGIVSILEAVIATQLGISLESTRRLRKWIKACRSGRRERIPRLRS